MATHFFRFRFRLPLKRPPNYGTIFHEKTNARRTRAFARPTNLEWELEFGWYVAVGWHVAVDFETMQISSKTGVVHAMLSSY